MKKLLVLGAFLAFAYINANAQAVTNVVTKDEVAVVKDENKPASKENDKECKDGKHKKSDKCCKEKGKSGEKKACCKDGHKSEAGKKEEMKKEETK